MKGKMRALKLLCDYEPKEGYRLTQYELTTKKNMGLKQRMEKP